MYLTIVYWLTQRMLTLLTACFFLLHLFTGELEIKPIINPFNHGFIQAHGGVGVGFGGVLLMHNLRGKHHNSPPEYLRLEIVFAWITTSNLAWIINTRRFCFSLCVLLFNLRETSRSPVWRPSTCRWRSPTRRVSFNCRIRRHVTSCQSDYSSEPGTRRACWWPLTSSTKREHYGFTWVRRGRGCRSTRLAGF